MQRVFRLLFRTSIVTVSDLDKRRRYETTMRDGGANSLKPGDTRELRRGGLNRYVCVKPEYMTGFLTALKPIRIACVGKVSL